MRRAKKVAAASLVSVLVLSPSLYASPALATSQVDSIEVTDIDKGASSVSIEWSPVKGADKYVVYEELGTKRTLNRPFSPVHEGSKSKVEISGLDSGEVTHARIVAVDDREKVVARSLVRASAGGSKEKGDGITWVANDSDFSANIDVPDANESDVMTREIDPDKDDVTSSTGEASLSEDQIKFEDGSYSGKPEEYTIRLAPEQSGSSSSSKERRNDKTDPGTEWFIDVPTMGKNSSGTLKEEAQLSRDAMSYGVYFTHLVWDAFIKDKYVEVNKLCDQADPDKDLFFNGNDRDFKIIGTGPPAGDNSKIYMRGVAHFNTAEWDWDPETGSEFVGWMDPKVGSQKEVGITGLLEKQDDGSMELNEWEQAPLEDVNVGIGLESPTTANIRFMAESSNPLCTIWGASAPAIDIDIEATLVSDGTITISGLHNKAPSHQSWVLFATGPLTGETIADPPKHQEWYEARMSPEDKCLYIFENKGFSNLGLPPTGFDPSDEPFNPDCTPAEE